MSARGTVARIFTSRTIRGIADGLVSVLLADHLGRIGLSPREVGAVVTATLLGSAGLTLLLGVYVHRLDRRVVLLAACALMVATGAGFATLSAFLPLMLVAIVGTLNPSAGDVSVFLPTEQSVLADGAKQAQRTWVFAWYNVLGSLAGAVGAAAAAIPERLARMEVATIDVLQRAAFGFYALVGVVTAAVYVGLPSMKPVAATSAPLAKSRRTVMVLAALFSLDSFAGGFVVQALLVYWLRLRFGFSLEATGAIFFAVGILNGLSQLVSPWIAARVGLIQTMVYTHIPANLFLVLAGVVPSPTASVVFLLCRAALSSMDVPARQAYVMSIVPPEERAAAATMTNIPRSLASAIPPLFTGLLLERSSFGWPLVIAGVLKTIYDLVLFVQFRARRAPEEA